jgi:flavin reductase (DIM6/NTAB) family NADH-FMN oxidoreductase RutF
VDELAMSGLTAVPGTHVRCPRIAEAPASLECRRYITLAVGKSREILLGQVLGVFIRDGLVDPASKHVDQHGMDAIGRLGGHGYSRIRDQFDLKTISLAGWTDREVDGLPERETQGD